MTPFLLLYKVNKIMCCCLRWKHWYGATCKRKGYCKLSGREKRISVRENAF